MHTRNPSLFLVACTLILFCGLTGLCCAAPPLVIGNADTYPLAGTLIDVLEDPGRSLAIDDVASPRLADRFQPVRQRIPNFGMTESAFWFRFTIAAGPHSAHSWLLYLDQPLMSRVELYLPRSDGGFDVRRTGTAIPLSQRDLQERDNLLRLPLDGGPRTFYLRAWIAGRAQFPLTVLTREAYDRQETAQNFVFGACVGFMLVMTLLGFALLGLLRDRSYLLYVWYTVTILLVQLGLNGYLYMYILPEQPRLHEYVIVMLCTLALLAGTLFARRFLRLNEYAPRLHHLFNVLAGLNLLMLLFCHVTPPLIFKRLLNIDLLISSVMALTAAVLCYRRGFLPARYYAYGRLFLSVGGLVYPLVNEGVLPVTAFTKNALLLASSGDILFILLAMGHHYHGMNQQVRGLVSDLKREVDERTAAHRALQKQMEERIRLEAALLRASREERRRISNELHDGLCQQLTAARLRFAALENRLKTAGLRNEAQPLSDLLQETVDHAYGLSRRLWHSDDTSSEDPVVLDELVRRLVAQSGIPITLELDREAPSCSSVAMMHIQFIAREAMVNAVKHSGAAGIAVSLQCSADDGIHLEVRDSGRGMGISEERGGGLGIGMMEYRAEQAGGRIEISTRTEDGTSVVCAAPCSGICRGEPVAG